VTTDATHERPGMTDPDCCLALTAPNQRWVADITYILLEEFTLLGVILDAFSRRVLGWELGKSPQTSLAIPALDRAVGDRRGSGRHHSSLGPGRPMCLGRSRRTMCR